jgi:hypothetical protein
MIDHKHSIMIAKLRAEYFPERLIYQWIKTGHMTYAEFKFAYAAITADPSGDQWIDTLEDMWKGEVKWQRQ